MKPRETTAGILRVLLVCAIAGHAWETNKLYPMPRNMPLIGEAGRSDTAWYFDSLKNADSLFTRLSVPVREGGWSALERDTTDPTGHTFWTINDRGLNVAHEVGGRSDKVFPFPGYTHKLLRIRVQGDSVAVLSIDSIKSLEDAAVFTTGLVSTKAATGETALRMRLDSAKVDTSTGNKIAPVANGYDFEAIRKYGNSLFLSDEYGPFVVEVDIPTLRIKKEWYPGMGLPEVLKKRRANRGMEGMAVTPSGKIVGVLQSAMHNQVGGNTNATRDGEMLRVVWLDPVTGKTREFAYLSDLKDGKRRGRDVKTSEVIALSETRFLVLEQGVENTVEKLYHIDIFEIDITHATDISATGPDGLVIGGKTLEQIAIVRGDLAKTGIVPVAKRLLVGDLIRNSVWRSEKPEGIAVIDDSTLAINNDNDYGMTDYGADGVPHMLAPDQIVPNVMYFRIPKLSARLADTLFPKPAAFRLTILHNNDGESQLIDAGNGATDRGGVDRFKALVDSARTQAAAKGRHVITLTAGDNFLAGKEFQASLDREATAPIYDGIALDLVGYDALTIGNHDFDFGPDVLARFIRSFATSKAPFLSANLSFASEPALKALADSGRIRSHIVLDRGGEKVGIVGATTPTITTISSPRRTTIDTNVVAAIQSRVDSLVAAGVNKIVVVSHLQAVSNDTLMAKKLRNVDLLLAGGGDELLGSTSTLLQPGDAAPVSPYPIKVQDADGKTVYVVTAPGDYLYLGQLEADFDDSGRVIRVVYGSGPRRVVGGSFPDAVGRDAAVKAQVVDPVAAYVSSLSSIIVGRTQQGLNGVRNDVRSKPTNLGALTADAMLWQSARIARNLGIDTARIALQNGGGIRNAAVIPAGPLTMSNMFDIAPFGNKFAVFPRLPVTTLKDGFENAVRLLPATSGGYAQIAGANIWIDTSRAGATLDASGKLATRGSRVRLVVMGTSDTLVRDGQVVDSSRRVPFATIDFLATGGDGYPFGADSFVVAPIAQHQFLRDYISSGLDSIVDSTRYPIGFSGRVHILPSTPVSAASRLARSARFHAANGRLTGALVLAEAGSVRMDLLDIQGRTVATTGNREYAAGPHTLSLAPSGRGLFLLRLDAPGLRQTRTVQILD